MSNHSSPENLGRSDRQRNVRLALILATVAVTFFLGFVTRMVMLSHQ
jgi:hypothetical protein